jgi:glycine dehydrogenase
MLAIRREIDAVGRGAIAIDDSPLRHAPHPAEDLLDGWNRPYPPADGAFPDVRLRVQKYFPPVSRIDGAYGDRHLVCSCEPLESYVPGGDRLAAGG